jgi:hypothetical protein
MEGKLMKFLILMSLLITELALFNGNSAIAATNYYRWQDAQGNWHFSDQPPIPASTDTNISKILGQTVNTSKPLANSFGQTLTKSNKKSVSKRLNSKKVARELKLQLKQEQVCQTLKVNLDVIQAKLRTGYKEPSGNKLREKRRKLNNKIYHQC